MSAAGDGRGGGPPATTPLPPHSNSGGQFLLQLLQGSSSHHHPRHPDPAAVDPAIPIPIPSSPPLFARSPPSHHIWSHPGHFDASFPRGRPTRPQQDQINGIFTDERLVFGTLKYEAAEVAPPNGGARVSSRVLDPPPGFAPRRNPIWSEQSQRVEGSSPLLHRAPNVGGWQMNGGGHFYRERWVERGGQRAGSGSSFPPRGVRIDDDLDRSRPLVDHETINEGAHERLVNIKDEDMEAGEVAERFTDMLALTDESSISNGSRQSGGFRVKDVRSHLPRIIHIENFRLRSRRRVMECRRDVERLTPQFLSIYESLVPSEEEKLKQKQLLASLQRLINKEWPTARLYLYGSCANSFAFSNSDIDVCMSIDETGVNKTDVILKLADMLKSDNMENVQPLTRARVPIVKLMDPVTGISCDICINNLLAVVNTKLLRDYAQIDPRLHQLAFLVKHWAKCRGVNETYRGTLSSYAYVLMSVHFLQLRQPPILPCLQEMRATYVTNVEDIECAYYDKVENLRGFGSHNKESIAKLLWEFFDYWAYRHNYTNDVISVRTGSIISKGEKDWTRRVGNDRHLICIEDPFEVSHDLGRVVDRYSIKDLRVEFERAAYILHYDRNPCVSLFEPYMLN